MNLIGIPIGFYGYAFPGNINLMVVELYRLKKYHFLLFTLGLILFFETVYCTIALTLLNTLKIETGFYRAMEWSAYLMMASMGAWMIIESRKKNDVIHKNAIKRGLISIVIHPQQIPFWLVMGVFINKFIPIHENIKNVFLFAMYNAIGTLLAMLFYMVFGSQLLKYFQLNNSQINLLMGTTYLVIAFKGALFP